MPLGHARRHLQLIASIRMQDIRHWVSWKIKPPLARKLRRGALQEQHDERFNKILDGQKTILEKLEKQERNAIYTTDRP